MELTRDQASWSAVVDQLRAVRDARHLQSVRGGLDGGAGRIDRSGPRVHQHDLYASGRQPPPAGHPLRARLAHGVRCTQLLADLGVRRSFSRPYCSNDNAFSEAQFKTMKYHAGYPQPFGSLQDARNWARQFMDWYNDVHYHSELALMRPCTVHCGRGREVRNQRQRVMEKAYTRNPERFLRGIPKIAMLPREAWINKPNSLCTTPSGPEGQATSRRQTHPEPIPLAGAHFTNTSQSLVSFCRAHSGSRYRTACGSARLLDYCTVNCFGRCRFL